ncbi:MAG: hypothetical protein JW714_03110, partial [Candidatus Omnitrophica bacterium]|nr:hypothetical protein [Candidatus Omnitrophota bacterium]
VEQARNEAARRVKLAFILAEIARRENIQVSNEDLDKRIESIVQRSGKTKEEVQGYLEKQDLIFGLRQEIIDRKTIDFLIRKAQIET